MTENLKLPRKLSEERKPPLPRRPSHASVIENLERWANSPGLQPPASIRRERSLNFLKPGRDRRPRASDLLRRQSDARSANKSSPSRQFPA